MELILERCQFAEVLDEQSIADGEAGRGVYAYVPSPSMRAYYSARGERCFRLRMRCGDVADLSKGTNLADLVEFARSEIAAMVTQIPHYQAPRVGVSNVQRFARIIDAFIQSRYSLPDVILLPHRGPGIPTGVQAVIKNLSMFDVELLPARPKSRLPRPEDIFTAKEIDMESNADLRVFRESRSASPVGDAVRDHLNAPTRRFSVDRALRDLMSGSEVTSEQRETLVSDVKERILRGEQGDDLPIAMEALGCNYDAACEAVRAQDRDRSLCILNSALMKSALATVRGEVLGYGLPDWPETMTSFEERRAYQLGIAHACIADKLKLVANDHKDSGNHAHGVPFMTAVGGHVLFHRADGSATLPDEWVGICVDGFDTKSFWYIGKSDGERSYTRLESRIFGDAVNEAIDRQLIEQGFYRHIDNTPAVHLIEARMQEALKQAWPLVNRPFVSESARNEVGKFVSCGDIRGQRVPMLFGLQTAWTFVHGSGNEPLLQEFRRLLDHGAILRESNPAPKRLPPKP